MRIGIISLYGWLKLWDNYGTVMQNYALQEVLRRHGHDTFWIRTRDSAETPQRKPTLLARAKNIARGSLVKLLKPLRGESRQVLLERFRRQNPRHFGTFIERFVPTTSSEYTIEELRATPPTADAFIVGSDQVWKYATPMNFLGFGEKKALRVAYAVSAPWPLLSEDWHTKAAILAKQLTAVSVREVDGLAVCRRIGRDDAVQVVDPTLLLDASDYLKLIENGVDEPGFDETFVLGYFVNLRSLRNVPWMAIQAFAESRNSPLHVIPLQGSELVVPTENVATPSPTGWLKALYGASAIITNSFHGALFAVIMHRPFLVVLQTGATEAENCRFYSALEPLGLAHRIMPFADWSQCSGQDLDRWMNAPVDWVQVDLRLNTLRQRSIQFLLDALERRVE